ncbi:MAG: hypothetical protein K5770_08640 [Lachnospiraceae bacterium]|nr:hypothetical protein [Lachnospiraceae bacterium]
MQRKVKIAVAYDDAFGFYYRTGLEALKKAGAELLFFSPIEDKELPSGISGLYLGGGYPELFLKELSENKGMKGSILSALNSGLPAVAECGGFMYLHSGIYDVSGEYYEMTGFIDGSVYYTGALRRFGYVWLSSDKDSMLLKKGERVPAHEFHYYESTAPGGDFYSIKAGSGAGAEKKTPMGYTNGVLYAGFPHLELSGELPLAGRFVERAEEYSENEQA